MTVKDVLFVIGDESGLTKTNIAERVGCAKTTLSTQLSRNGGMGMKVSTLIRILEALDYQLVVQSTLTDEEFNLDGEDEGFGEEE